jgi:DUF971 family protein
MTVVFGLAIPELNSKRFDGVAIEVPTRAAVVTGTGPGGEVEAPGRLGVALKRLKLIGHHAFDSRFKEGSFAQYDPIDRRRSPERLFHLNTASRQT